MLSVFMSIIPKAPAVFLKVNGLSFSFFFFKKSKNKISNQFQNMYLQSYSIKNKKRQLAALIQEFQLNIFKKVFFSFCCCCVGQISMCHNELYPIRFVSITKSFEGFFFFQRKKTSKMLLFRLNFEMRLFVNKISSIA